MPQGRPTLDVDLSAIRANYRLLKEKHSTHHIAAVVKANAYGLGMAQVSRALAAESCREFFVATLEEGLALRAVLPDADIGIFEGVIAGEEKEYAHHRLTPVLNDAGQLQRWQAASDARQAIIHIDTGMTRLGLSESDMERFSGQNSAPGAPLLMMSHLACANAPEHPKNREQLRRFRSALRLFPEARASLCNSAGIFLGGEFHFDLARPGCALYGINPGEGENPMRAVARLSAPILQIRTLTRKESVGYGASFHAPAGARLAVVAMGYADGYPRRLSNAGFAWVTGCKVPVAGRVSMDMLTLDISSVPEGALATALHAEFINAEQPVDALAAASGTIGYEIFTRIGERVKRLYHE